MMFSSNYSGQDPKEGTRELILDEHMECGCQCGPGARYNCAGHFNDLTCECECDEQTFGDMEKICNSQPGTEWDPKSCMCKNEGFVPRRVDTRDVPCQDNPQQHYSLTRYSALSCLLLGCFITTSLFLLVTTIRYRRKIRKLKMFQASGNSSVGFSEDANVAQLESFPAQHKSRNKNQKKKLSGHKPKSQIGFNGRDRERESRNFNSSYQDPAPCHNTNAFYQDYRGNCLN